MLSKCAFCFLFLFLCLFLQGWAQTTIPAGSVKGNWTRTNSPYLITGNISILDTTTLTIEPGVEVVFQGHYRFTVQGRLLAVGLVNDSITFTAQDTLAGWNGIHYEFIQSHNDSSRFVYCNFRYGKATQSSPYDNGGAFYIKEFGKINISHSTITNCSADDKGAAIYCEKSSVLITDNTIAFNKGKVGTIYILLSSTKIIRNLITKNSVRDGGGIYCYNTYTPLISLNTISYNMATGSSAGIGCYVNGNPEITKNLITHNNVTASIGSTGAGIVCDHVNLDITGNTITYNFLDGDGAGGVYINTSPTRLKSNIISNNVCTGIGGGDGAGGVYSGGLEVFIIANRVDSNTTKANFGAGGIYCTTKGEVSYNIVSNNKAFIGGSGIYASGIMKILNNVVVNNSATTKGGAVYLEKLTDAEVSSNTIANNSGVNGGGLFFKSSSPILKNNILWGNTASDKGNQVYLYDNASDPTITFCDIEGDSSAFGANTGVFFSGTYFNNLNADPKFISPSAGSGNLYDGLTANWRLQTTSPCVNTGDKNGNYPIVDIDNHFRVYGGIIDLGAYETFYTITDIKNEWNHSKFIVYPNPSGQGNRFFTIDAGEHTLNKVTIYNVLGECIYSVQPSSANCIVDLSLQPVGIYFVKVYDNDDSYIKKIIIQ